MIFVTVGTHNAPFDRLIRWMDEIGGGLDETMVMQIGSATYMPRHGQSFRFCSTGELARWISQARVVVAHGGASVREIIQTGRPVIVVPRLARFREVVNDHQLELAEVLAGRGLITLANDLSALEKALSDPALPVGRLASPDSFIQILRETLERFS